MNWKMRLAIYSLLILFVLGCQRQAISPITTDSETSVGSVDALRSTSEAVTKPIMLDLGFPRRITILPFSIPIQESSGSWVLWTGAFISDQSSNPVASNIAVSFFLVPDTVATIGGGSSTGNLGPNFNRTPGVAYKRISFRGERAFDSVCVVARCLSENALGERITVTGQRWFILPLLQGSIQLNVTPLTYHFGASGDTVTHNLQSIVRDGYGTAIPRAPVRFTAQYGRIVYNGTTATLIVTRQEVFGTDPSILERTNEVTAYIEGYPEVLPVGSVINYQRAGR